MSVPLLNLRPQYESLKSELHNAISGVIESQQFILGKEVQEFECDAAGYIGSKYTLGVTSGSDALIMALMALDIGPGDEVITTPYSFFATVGSIYRVGATPVFVDICDTSYNIDTQRIEEKITSKTKAIMPVHLFGQSAKMDKIIELGKKYNIPVIEDAAQAIGSTYEGKQVGNIGDIGCFSFFPSKNLGCFGDGGMVTTNSEELFHKLSSIRNHGQNPAVKYQHQYVGGNFRIDTLQAAILKVKLPHLNSWVESRRQNANIYYTLFNDLLPKGTLDSLAITLPKEESPSFHTFNQFVVRIPFRDKFLEAAKNANIGVMVYYPFPLHLQPCFSSMGFKEGDFKVSETAALQTVALPIYPEAPKSDLEQVAELLVKTGKECGAW